MMALCSKPDIAAEVAALSGLSREDLVRHWCIIYNVPPPKGIRQEFMVRAVAWHLQAKRLGGLSAGTRRLLRSAIAAVERDMLARDRQSHTAAGQELKLPDDDKVVANRGNEASASFQPRERRRLTPGARLLRERNGRTHVVDVIERGYVFEARVYSSLTAIADRITGAHWSGPRFFGL